MENISRFFQLNPSWLLFCNNKQINKKNISDKILTISLSVVKYQKGSGEWRHSGGYLWQLIASFSRSLPCPPSLLSAARELFPPLGRKTTERHLTHNTCKTFCLCHFHFSYLATERDRRLGVYILYALPLEQ